MDAQAVFQAHHLALYRWLRRATGRDDVAEDLLQETFLRAVRVSPGPPAGEERAWLYGVARNLLLNRKRDEARRPSFESGENGLRSPAPSFDLGPDLSTAIDQLPAPESEAFLLREVGGLGYLEIAHVVGGTADAVRNRIFRARQALRGALRLPAARTEDR